MKNHHLPDFVQDSSLALTGRFKDLPKLIHKQEGS